MEEQLTRFPEQFSWEPALVGEVPSFDRVIVCGMGGSALPARLLSHLDPALPFSIHQDYGLPYIKNGEKVLVILSSHSGETEEVLDSAREATSRGLACAVIASGGALLAFAKESSLPSIELPKDHFEPRMALGYMLLALTRIIGAKDAEAKLRTAGGTLDVASIKNTGTKLADRLKEYIPLIYASDKNAAVAYIWKITMNETAKIPAFTDAVPEACHNELTGFDVAPATHPLSERLIGIFLHDSDDHPRNEKRLTLMEELFHEKGIEAVRMDLSGSDAYQKSLSGIITGSAAALTLAKHYGVPDSATPIIEAFKARMRS